MSFRGLFGANKQEYLIGIIVKYLAQNQRDEKKVFLPK